MCQAVYNTVTRHMFFCAGTFGLLIELYKHNVTQGFSLMSNQTDDCPLYFPFKSR